MKKLLFAIITILACSSASFAIPVLQLDIQGGVYDLTTETIVAQSNSFTVYAYLKVGDSKNPVSDDYFLSVALSPQFGPGPGNLGSFVFDQYTGSDSASNGQKTISVTSEMLFGVPPLEANLAKDPHDLPQHGMFPTFFVEQGFKFIATQQSGQYNTQDDSGQGPIAGSGMYYMAFTFNVANLDPRYIIHFDLYNTRIKNSDIDVTQFAPFSHDAESGPRERVPEPLLQKRRHSLRKRNAR